MTMLEKVARAIFPVDKPSPEAWERHKEVARVAIEAMRSPTDEMISNIRPSLLPQDVWRTMIDNALKE
jgi:hypothetical protein